MFQQFMQMGTPAAVALVGMSFAFVGLVVANMIRSTAEREDGRKFELSRLEAAKHARTIEHKGTRVE